MAKKLRPLPKRVIRKYQKQKKQGVIVLPTVPASPRSQEDT